MIKVNLLKSQKIVKAVVRAKKCGKDELWLSPSKYNPHKDLESIQVVKVSCKTRICPVCYRKQNKVKVAKIIQKIEKAKIRRANFITLTIQGNDHKALQLLKSGLRKIKQLRISTFIRKFFFALQNSKLDRQKKRDQVKYFKMFLDQLKRERINIFKTKMSYVLKQYFYVIERGQGQYHIHYLLFGHWIIPQVLLSYWWREKTGFFIVFLTHVRNIQKVIAYIVKYMLKENKRFSLWELDFWYRKKTYYLYLMGVKIEKKYKNIYDGQLYDRRQYYRLMYKIYIVKNE